MSDIVERLRRLGSDSVGNYGMPIAREAADEIEWLRAEVDLLTGRFSEIAPCDPGDISELISARACARYREVLAERDRLRAELAQFKKDGGEAIIWNKRRCAEMEAERDRLLELLRGVLIGGNHVALLIGADHPPHTAPWQFALSHYGAGDKYEAWCCWKAIMQVRDELERIDAALKEGSQ